MYFRDRQVVHRVAIVGVYGDIIDNGPRLVMDRIVVCPSKCNFNGGVCIRVVVRVGHGGRDVHDIAVG